MAKDPLFKLQDEAVRKLGRLVECIRLLDLNKWDADFRSRTEGGAGREFSQGGELKARKGPELYYVLDTNFIQSFIQPAAWSRVSHLFHEFDLWSFTEREGRDQEEVLKLQQAVSAQATLLATEFVLGEALKSASGKLYMSSWHQKELSTQIEALARHHRERGKDTFVERARSRHQAISDCLKVRGFSKAEFQEEIDRDDKFVGPGVTVSGLSNADFDRIKDTYVLSIISRELAQDDVVEPGLQVRRLNALWDKIQTVDWTFSSRSRQDTEEIKNLKKAWTTVLHDEFRRRPSGDGEEGGKGVSRTGGRTEKSIPADAETMGYLTWLSQRLGDEKRVVFVTGDSLIINAYRRWYADVREDIPFVLRPISMYAPQYNLRRAKSTIAEQAHLFERTRLVLEGWASSMGPSLRLHYLEDRDRFSRYDDARARDRFCLDASEGNVPPGILEDLVPYPGIIERLKTHIESMDSTADSLRWLERLALGSVPDLVRPRVASAERWIAEATAAFDDIATGAPEAEGVLERMAKKHLTDVQAGGFAFSLPVAVDQIAKFAELGPGGRPIRAKVAVRLALPFKGELLPVADWIKAVEGEQDRAPIVRHLAKTPALAFALASLLAVRQSRWSEAIRFAGFASRASEIDGSDEVPDRELGDECRYLRAVALRIRMMSEAPRPDHHQWDIWKQDLSVAEDALAECIVDHESATQDVRRLRAISERAAVRLTYCGWAAVGTLADLDVYRDRHLELEEVFHGAVADLQECAQRLPELRSKPGPTGLDRHAEDRKEMLNWIEAQQAVNPECARLIYQCLTTRVMASRDEVLMRRLPAAEVFLFDAIQMAGRLQSDDHPTARAYATIIAIRMGARSSESEIRETLETARREATLALDRAMIDAMAAFAGLSLSN